MEEKVLEEAQAKIKELEEAQKKHEADTERGVQKVLSEKKELEQMLERQQKLSSDGSVINELASKDRDYAQKILDRFFGGLSVDDAIAQVGGDATKTETKVDLQAEIQKGVEKSKVQDKINSFVEKLELNDEDKKKFMDALDENTPAKGINTSNVTKVLKHSLSDISDSIEDVANKEVIANAIAAWSKSKSPAKEDKKSKARENIKAFMQENWL